MVNINEAHPIPKAPDVIMRFESVQQVAPTEKKKKVKKPRKIATRTITIIATQPGDQKNLLKNSGFELKPPLNR